MKFRIAQRIFGWYFSNDALPYWFIFIIDSLIVFCSSLFIFAMNNGVLYTLTHFLPLCITLLFYLLFYILGFRIFHTYYNIVRYSTLVDVEYIGFAVTVGFSCSAICRQLFGLNEVFIPVRLRDIFMWSILAIVMMSCFRIFMKYIYDYLSQRRSKIPVFIYGVKQGGIGLANSIKSQVATRYVIKGFVSDFPHIVGHTLMGEKVYSHAEFVDKMIQGGVRTLFISPMRTTSFVNEQDIVDRLIANNVKIYMMPKEHVWDGKSKLDHTLLREVDVEDLLPREKIDVDMNAISELLCGKKVLITGAAGSIGSEIVRQVAVCGPAELTLIDQAETPMHDIRLMMARQYSDVKAQTIVADIADKSRMNAIFGEHRPDYVFHAAAYKHVPMMEDNPAESVKNNIEGTRIIADLAVKYNAKKFVMVSTDKAVNPTNVMGCSKRICEIYVQSLDKAIKDGQIEGCTQFITTRFGNVLGSNGSVIPLFREQIKRGGPITVTHPDIIRYFMLISEACKLVLEAGTMGHGGEIFVFDMGRPVKIVDLAKRMIALSDAKDIRIEFTGLRDGEKLYEEVLDKQETTMPTLNPKIKVAKVREYEYFATNKIIDKLVHDSDTETDMAIVGEMKEIVPEYKSRHSKYEALDK